MNATAISIVDCSPKRLACRIHHSTKGISSITMEVMWKVTASSTTASASVFRFRTYSMNANMHNATAIYWRETFMAMKNMRVPNTIRQEKPHHRSSMYRYMNKPMAQYSSMFSKTSSTV